jgi:hypothetical protein
MRAQQPPEMSALLRSEFAHRVHTRNLRLTRTAQSRARPCYRLSVFKLQTLAFAAALAALAGAAAGAPDDHAQAPTAASTTNKTESLPEVTVTAERLRLEQRVSKYVTQIAAVENGGEGLARWDAPPACPLVSGLPRQDGEFILERLSQIGREAGVPLADEHCRPNLYILVTPEPEDLLRGMEKRNRGYTFGYDASSYPHLETPASVVDEFIKTPRAVKVWYNPIEKDHWGQPLGYCQSQSVLALCDEVHHTAACDPNRYYRCGLAVAGGSHVELNSIWDFSRVFVIVDQRRLQGVTRDQLADYVAMVGFAKLKTDARLEDAPTILKLFDGAPMAAPAGMTDWDQTFLKSLYATEQTSKQQRGEIARSMVRDIVH